MSERIIDARNIVLEQANKAMALVAVAGAFAVSHIETARGSDDSTCIEQAFGMRADGGTLSPDDLVGGGFRQIGTKNEIADHDEDFDPRNFVTIIQRPEVSDACKDVIASRTITVSQRYKGKQNFNKPVVTRSLDGGRTIAIRHTRRTYTGGDLVLPSKVTVTTKSGRTESKSKDLNIAG